VSRDTREVLRQVVAELERRRQHLHERPITAADLQNWSTALRLATVADEAAEQRQAAHTTDARLWREPSPAH
jgi:RNA:NAD 2'-phosphotransferase (TPT1/KptA family)